MSLLILLFSAFLTASATAQPSNEEKLKAFLKHYFEVVEPSPDIEELRYFDALTDLNDDKKEEAVVFLVGDSFCGSGGCSLMILSSTSKGFKLINTTSIVRLPVRQLTTSSHGWKDLAVTVGGGGVIPYYEATLRFNGNNYPKNPSVPPAIKTRKKAEGKILLPDVDNYFDHAKILRLK